MGYDRQAAVRYAAEWAMRRNPRYADFEEMGGDCTNFISQCLYAGAGVMNYTPDTGWYYIDLNRRSAAWTGVEYLYRFLTTNRRAGPFGRELPLAEAVIGDVIQLSFHEGVFTHSLLVVGFPPGRRDVLVAAHSYDAFARPLSSYYFEEARLIHIEGVGT